MSTAMSKEGSKKWSGVLSLGVLISIAGHTQN